MPEHELGGVPERPLRPVGRAHPLEPAEGERAERVPRVQGAVASARAVGDPAPVDELVALGGRDQDVAGMRRGE